MGLLLHPALSSQNFQFIVLRYFDEDWTTKTLYASTKAVPLHALRFQLHAYEWRTRRLTLEPDHNIYSFFLTPHTLHAAYVLSQYTGTETCFRSLQLTQVVWELFEMVLGEGSWRVISNDFLLDRNRVAWYFLDVTVKVHLVGCNILVWNRGHDIF
jgi:hypothetical protein